MLHEVCQRIDDERQRRSKFVGEVGEHSHPFFMPFVDFFLFHLLETDFPFSFLFVLLENRPVTAGLFLFPAGFGPESALRAY